MDTISESMLRKEFTEAFHRVWDTTVDIPLVNLEIRPEEVEIKTEDNWLAGVVWMGGSWTGCVTIAMPQSLLQVAFEAVLKERDNIPPSKENLIDLVRELTNMTAGNLKSILPGTAGLATPGCFEVTKIEDLDNKFCNLISLCYSCNGSSMIAELHGLSIKRYK